MTGPGVLPYKKVKLTLVQAVKAQRDVEV